MYGCGMGFGWIVSLMLVGVIIYIYNQKGSSGKSERSAQDVLDERYAKGEIDHEEYKEKSEHLKGR